MTVRAVVRGLNRNRAIAACSALMDQCHVRLSKQNAQATSAQCCVARSKIMRDRPFQVSHDWVGNTRTNILAWWMPKVAIVVTLFAPVAVRVVVWIGALLWMGTACTLNAQRCGRTHCRYTGPFYLAMIVPAILLATGIFSANFYSWLAPQFLYSSVVGASGGPRSERGGNSHSADVRFRGKADMPFCTAYVR